MLIMKYLCWFSFLSLIAFSSCTTDRGTVEVDYVEARAIYGDIDEIRATPINESARAIENPGKIYIGERFILIGEEGEGIHVIDNSNRSNPESLAFINIPGNREYYVSDNMLYAESYYDLVKIDISNPLETKLVGRAENAVQEASKNADGEYLVGFTYENKSVVLNEDEDFYKEIIGDQLVYLDFAENVIPQSAVPSSFAGNSSSQSGTVNRVTKSGDFIYTISNNNLIIVSDGFNFGDEVRHYQDFKPDMETIFPYEGKLFMGSRTAMNIFDLSDPLQPSEIYEFDHVTSCDPVLPFEEMAYVTLRTADFSDCPGNINALVVLDLQDISNPKQLDEIQMSSPYGMSVIDDKLYVGEGENGLSIFNVKDERNPELLTLNKEIEAYDIISDPVDKNIIFIAGPKGLQQFTMGSNQSFDLNSTILF